MQVLFQISFSVTLPLEIILEKCGNQYIVAHSAVSHHFHFFSVLFECPVKIRCVLFKYLRMAVQY